MWENRAQASQVTVTANGSLAAVLMFLGNPTLSIYGHPFPCLTCMHTGPRLYPLVSREKKPLIAKFSQLHAHLLQSPANGVSHTESESIWQDIKAPVKSPVQVHLVQTLKEKSYTMKLLPDNIRVLYFAGDCLEPYVEVGYDQSRLQSCSRCRR